MTGPTEIFAPAGQVKTMLRPGQPTGCVAMKHDEIALADFTPKVFVSTYTDWKENTLRNNCRVFLLVGVRALLLFGGEIGDRHFAVLHRNKNRLFSGLAMHFWLEKTRSDPP
jgi:hypothetical protein